MEDLHVANVPGYFEDRTDSAKEGTLQLHYPFRVRGTPDGDGICGNAKDYSAKGTKFGAGRDNLVVEKGLEGVICGPDLFPSVIDIMTPGKFPVQYYSKVFS